MTRWLYESSSRLIGAFRQGLWSDRVVADELSHAGYDLGSVELDRGHELVVGEAGHAELEVEAACSDQLATRFESRPLIGLKMICAMVVGTRNGPAWLTESPYP
jgi:hypothetical protein